ncbi:MAG: MFS transporter [Haloferacaceae archaeon]
MSGDDGTVPWRSGTLYLLVAIAVVAPLDVNLVGPVLPAIAETFAVSNSRAGLVITAFAVPGVVLAPVVGMLADRVGRRQVLVPCLLVYGVAGALVTLAGDFATVLALRFVQGSVGGSILASLALTLVGDFYEGARRNAVMGLVSAAISVSAAVAPVAGGAMAAVSWDAPFALYGLSVVVAGAVFLFLDVPPLSGGDRSVDFSYLRNAVAALPTRDAVLFYGVNFVSFALLFGGTLAAVPFLLDGTYGLESGRIGALITGAMLFAAVVAIFNGRFARHLSNRELVAVGFFAYGVGLAGASVANSPVQVFLGLVVFGAGHGLVLPAVAAGLSELSPTRFRGGVMSVRTSLVLASQAVGPPLFTAPARAVGYETTLLAGGLVALVVAGVVSASAAA